MDIQGDLDVSGKYVFNLDSLPNVYAYNPDGTLASETRGPDLNGNSYKKTYAWANGVLTSESGWTKQ